MDHYLRPLIEHRKLIAIVAAVVTLLGIIASFVLPASYQATASVLLSPISNDPLAPVESDATVDMPTELQIAKSKIVVGMVAEGLAGQSISIAPSDLEQQVTVSSPRDSRILEVAFEADSPEVAQIGANTFANTYLSYRGQIAAENRSTAVAALNERVTLLKENLAEVNTELSRTEEGTSRHVTLTVEKESVEGELAAQQQALAELSTLSIGAGELIDPARLPTAAQGLGLTSILAGSLLGGLVLGCIAALLVAAVKASQAPRNRRATDRIEHNRRQEDRLLRGGRRASDALSESAVDRLARVTANRQPDPDEFGIPHPAALTGAMPESLASPEPVAEQPEPEQPVENAPGPMTPPPPPPNPEKLKASTTPSANGAIPPPPRNKAKVQPKDDDVESGSIKSTLVTEFAPLAKQIRQSRQGEPFVCMTVGERGRHEAIAVAFGLADALNTADSNILIIDSMVDAPSLNDLLELAAAPGLSELLDGGSEFDEAVQGLADSHRLDVITTGRITPTTKTALSGTALAELLSEAKGRYSATLIVAGTIEDAGLISGTDSELDGIVVGTEQVVGEAAGSSLASELSSLTAPVWGRISVFAPLTKSLGDPATASSM